MSGTRRFGMGVIVVVSTAIGAGLAFLIGRGMAFPFVSLR